MRTTRITVTVAMAAGFLFAPQASADATLHFSEPDFIWHHSGTPATPYHIWNTGDYWAQTFTDTGQLAADELWLTLFLDNNILNAGNRIHLDVLLNATTVGSFTIPQGVAGTRQYVFTFPPVTGPDYAVKLLATNTVPPLGGAASIGLDGRSFVTLVPEPHAWLALVGVLLARWRA